MILRFLGVGSAFCPPLQNTSFYLRTENEMYLFDCGSTVFSRLMDAQMLQKIRRLTVFISHCHADHVGSLGTLISYCHYVLKLPVTVVSPGRRLQDLLSLQGIRVAHYECLDQEYFADTNIDVHFIPVSHTDTMPCWGMLVKTRHTALYYSGDSSEIPKQIEEALKCKKIQYLFQDTQLCEQAPRGHGHYAALCKMFDRSERASVYPIHLNKDYRDLLRRDGFGVVTNEELDIGE